MKLSVQVVLPTDEGTAPVVREVFPVQREALTDQTLGLQLAKAKDPREAVPDTVVDAPVTQTLAEQAPGPHCGRPRGHKDSRDIVVGSLCGVLHLPSPRWWHCGHPAPGNPLTRGGTRAPLPRTQKIIHPQGQ
jgi:hypothetical protein